MKEAINEAKKSDVEQSSADVAISSDVSIVAQCVTHAIDIRTSQLERIKAKKYDFAPEFQSMTVQLYLLGVMWRHAETLGNNSEDGRELAFSAMKNLLLQERLTSAKASKRIEFLKKMSKMEDGRTALPVAVGYESEPSDDSLAEVLDHYVDDMQVSGNFWRVYDRFRKIMLYGGLAIAFVVIWFITLFMPGNSAIAILAAGLIAAALFVIPVFLIGIWMYRTKIKKMQQDKTDA